MPFRNRDEAARRLADRLAEYRGRHPLVLGIPRGAVPMAEIIAEALGGDLDVVLVHKLVGVAHISDTPLVFSEPSNIRQ
jgi:predicted phosphoribosyltransferase